MKQAYFPGDADQFLGVINALKAGGQKVVVLGHVRPDGDCIGSQVALVRILRDLGVDAVAVNGDTVPANCRPFVGDTPFYQEGEISLDGCMLASTDCADPKRFGSSLKGYAEEILLNVDHHISNTRFGKHSFIHPETSATAEILAGYCFDLDLPMDEVTAQALYVGIATDTGQFRHGTTTQQVFDICAELIRRGADPATAALELYEKEPISKLRLLQHFLGSLEFFCDGRVCMGSITPEVWKATGATKEDTEGIVDYARAIEGVEIGILIEEREGQTKGSFRANDPVHRVDLLAKEFNGGGHACAAGFNPLMPLDDLRPRLRAALEAHFEKIDGGALPTA